MLKENTVKIFEQSFKNNWNNPCLTDYNTKNTLLYSDFARNIARIHLFYKEIGIAEGDHVALIGKNNPTWVTVFIATITYGAVIVPILQDFNPNDAQHIVNHSEAKLLFASKSNWENLDFNNMRNVRAALSIDEPGLYEQKEGEVNE